MLTANKFGDLENPMAPLSFVELKPNNRKNVKCHISGDNILKGELIYRFQLFSLDTDIFLFAKKPVWETSDYHINYTQRFLKTSIRFQTLKIMITSRMSCL